MSTPGTIQNMDTNASPYSRLQSSPPSNGSRHAPTNRLREYPASSTAQLTRLAARHDEVMVVPPRPAWSPGKSSPWSAWARPGP